MKREFNESNILYLSTYPPRECGIATFARDLTSAIDKRIAPKLKTGVVAINSNGVNVYNYPNRVVHQISDTDMNDYIELAKKINASPNIKLVNVQHEYGMFGGEWGDYILPLLEIIEKPIVLTLHCVLPEPDEKLKRVVKAISESVDVIIVMTQKAVSLLRNVYKVNSEIQVIPHGIPVANFETQEKEKESLGYSDKIILSSYGLMSRNKGYEYVIESLPEVVKKYPNLIYLIVGETHPNIRKRDGEEYRNFLTNKIKKLGLEKNVKFYNKYITDAETIKYLKATDIYIAASNDPTQITSGTLPRAMGCGRAAISTPFPHAKDIITPERGLLTEFRNPESFKKAILYLLDNPELRRSMEKNAYYYTRPMTWSNVAIQYCDLFKKLMNINVEIETLPVVDTSHLIRMTDNFGIIQFSVQSTPDKNSGYTLDDNARAILICAKHYEKFKEYKQLSLIKTYLDYIKYVQKEDGRLFNFVDSSKKIDESWSEDAQGRAIWALGYLISSPEIPRDFKKEAEEILTKTFSSFNNFNSPRAIAFGTIGLFFYNQVKRLGRIRKRIKEMGKRLVDFYKENESSSWKWFEQKMTYANSKIPEALLYAYLATREGKFLRVGLESLKFLSGKTFIDNIFVPIGQRGWYENGKERSLYDQQPIEAAYMVQTLILAYKITLDEKYKRAALEAFQWFTGKNTLNQVVYNDSTGGCHDGIGENAINLNQGAESTISFLLARLSLIDIENQGNLVFN